MSKPNSTNGKLVRAAAYYRMSDDKQENSIDRQKSQVEPYAPRNGYEIVAAYTDEGIAGDEIAKRKDFQRLLRDAQRGVWDVILCDDKDRFGRFDSIDYGEIVAPLRRAGVRLETVAQGPVDWNSLAGRMMDQMVQEFKAAESRGISRRVATQMLRMALDGKYLGGPAPYGYRWVNDTERVKRLAPDRDTAKVVRLIFDLYGNRGYSLDGIARELYQRAILGPGKVGPDGRPPAWKKPTIRFILRNRKYVGDWTWNTKSEGKYTAIGEDRQVVSHALKNTHARRNALDKWVIVPESHEPLIDRELFERVQARLGQMRKKTTPRPNGGDYRLTGLLICGHCGWRMIGTTHLGLHKVYYCGRYHEEGKHACGYNRMREETVLKCIVRKIHEDYLNAERLTALQAEILRQDEEEAQADPERTAALRKRIGELEQQIANGNRNMALAPPDAVAGIAQVVRGLREERDRLAAERDRQERPTARADKEAAVAEAMKHLWRLHDALMSDDPREVRAALQELVVKVELWFTYRQTAKTTRSTFARGLITLRADARHICNLESAARPLPTIPDSGR
jgi:DNA invertase Pin-like site-specific DNA recombinase